MAFDSLSDKLQNVFKSLRSKGLLTEADVRSAMKEVKMALLEADVNFKVVKQFVNSATERAVGADVMNGLNPAQMVIKIVHEEMIALMGEAAELPLKSPSELTILMMAGLQGAGKTTTAAKLAGKFKSAGRRPLLAACDVYRPAAMEQLRVNGEKVGVPVFVKEGAKDAVALAKEARDLALREGHNLLIIDTAGRLQIDETLMQELVDIKRETDVNETLLVVDAMTGQEAVNVSKTFDEKVGIDGVILTKLDGDTRGGAALSVRSVTGKPIYYAGMGEKLSDLEKFVPDRMASRILGMGDILTLIEKAESELDEAKAREMEQKLRKAEFDFNDYLESMSQMKKMGGIASILSLLPGIGKSQMSQLNDAVDDQRLKRIEAMIFSMTPKERANPSLLNPGRKNRIAKGAGVDIGEVNRLVKQFEQAKKMMKQMPGMMGKKGRRGGFQLPF
ncbi:MAG: signal recognition particle protein [Lachnospiraceae bacterium]|nr:signal recognition particle protein [Lachnospiraceae bacterium]